MLLETSSPSGCISEIISLTQSLDTPPANHHGLLKEIFSNSSRLILIPEPP